MANPTLTPNTPSAGYFSWTAFHIVYLGVDYPITAGNSNLKYTWWLYNGGAGGPLQSSNTLPTTLTDDDLMLFLNHSGIAINAQTTTVMYGDLIVPGTVLAGALEATAIDGMTITSAVFQTATGLGSGVQGMEMSADTVGGVLKFWTGISGEVGPGWINPDIVTLPTLTSLALPPTAAGATQIASPSVGSGSRTEINLWPFYLQIEVPNSGLMMITGGPLEVDSLANFYSFLISNNAFFTNDATTSTNSANAVILSGGRLVTFHSSQSKNKLEQRDLDLDLAEEHVTKLRPRTWLDKTTAEGYVGADGEDIPGRPDGHRTGGFIVEETPDDLLTDHGPGPDVDLQHIIADLVRVVQSQSGRITSLETQN